MVVVSSCLVRDLNCLAVGDVGRRGRGTRLTVQDIHLVVVEREGKVGGWLVGWLVGVYSLNCCWLFVLDV